MIRKKKEQDSITDEKKNIAQSYGCDHDQVFGITILERGCTLRTGLGPSEIYRVEQVEPKKKKILHSFARSH
jgi:hypothetical protein